MSNSKFKVGGMYSCGGELVKIVYEEPIISKESNEFGNNKRAIAVSVQPDGHVWSGYSKLGFFDPEKGHYSVCNPKELRHCLKEVEGL